MERRFPQRPSTETRGTKTPWKKKVKKWKCKNWKGENEGWKRFPQRQRQAQRREEPKLPNNDNNADESMLLFHHSLSFIIYHYLFAFYTYEIIGWSNGKSYRYTCGKICFSFLSNSGRFNLYHHFINLFKSFVCINLNGEKFNFKDEYFKTLFC